MARAVPLAREPFGNEHHADRLSVARDEPELAAILVLVAARVTLEHEGTGVEQRVQAPRRLFPQLLFVRAAITEHLGRIDVGDAEGRAAIAKRVAVDDAVIAVVVAAKRKARSLDAAPGAGSR